MAFVPYQGDSARVPPYEYHPCSAITPKVGMALKLVSGQLAAAAGADAPLYISACEKDAACQAGDVIPVIRVQPDMIFESTAAAAMTGVAAGDRVNIHSDSLQVAADKGGAAEIVALEGTAAGSRVLLRLHPAAAG